MIDEEDYTETTSEAEASPGFIEEVQRAIQSVPQPAPAPAADEREALRQRWKQPEQTQPQEPPVGVSPLARQLENEGWFSRLESEHAVEREQDRQEAIRRSEESAREMQRYGGGELYPGEAEGARRFDNTIRNIPQALGVTATQVPGGAISGVGSLLQAPDVTVSGVEHRGHAAQIRQLAIMDRIDRGERVRPADDLYGYQDLTPVQRDAVRARVQNEVATFNPTPIQDRTLYQAGEAVQQYGRTFHENVLGMPLPEGYDAQSFSVQVGQGLGSMLVGLPVVWATGPVGGGIVFGGMGMGEATQRAVEFDRRERAEGRPGLAQEQIILAGILGVGPGTTDVLPVEALLGRLPLPIPPWLKTALARSVARVGGQMIVEGVQEGGQQFLQNLIAWQVYNPDQVLTEDVIPNLVVGGGAGGEAAAAGELGRAALSLVPGRRRGGHGAVQEARVRSGPAQTETAAPRSAAPAAPPETVQPTVEAPAAPEAAQPETFGFNLPVTPAPEAAQPQEAAPAPDGAPQAEQAPAAAPVPSQRPTLEQIIAMDDRIVAEGQEKGYVLDTRSSNPEEAAIAYIRSPANIDDGAIAAARWAMANGREDIARVLESRARTQANRSQTTPGLDPSSPKYAAAKADLAKIKEEADALAAQLAAIAYPNVQPTSPTAAPAATPAAPATVADKVAEIRRQIEELNASVGEPGVQLPPEVTEAIRGIDPGLAEAISPVEQPASLRERLDALQPEVADTAERVAEIERAVRDNLPAWNADIEDVLAQRGITTRLSENDVRAVARHMARDNLSAEEAWERHAVELFEAEREARGAPELATGQTAQQAQGVAPATGGAAATTATGQPAPAAGVAGGAPATGIAGTGTGGPSLAGPGPTTRTGAAPAGAAGGQPGGARPHSGATAPVGGERAGPGTTPAAGGHGAVESGVRGAERGTGGAATADVRISGPESQGSTSESRPGAGLGSERRGADVTAGETAPTNWLQSLTAQQREAVFVAMRRLDEKAEKAHAKARFIMGGGGIPIGSANFDDTIKGVAFESFLRALRNGATPDVAEESARAEMREAVATHNRRGPPESDIIRSFNWKRDSEFGGSNATLARVIIESAVRDPDATTGKPTDAQRTQLRSIIASRFPLNWGTIQARLGTTPEQMEALRQEALNEGLLRQDRNGVYRRTPAAVRNRDDPVVQGEEQAKALEDLGGVIPSRSKPSRRGLTATEVEKKIAARQEVDLSEDAEAVLTALEAEPSFLPSYVREAAVVKMTPPKGRGRKWTVTVMDADGELHRFKDEGDEIATTEALFITIKGIPVIAYAPHTLASGYSASDLLEGASTEMAVDDPLRAAVRGRARLKALERLRGLRVHEAGHFLRDLGFLPGDRGDTASIWGRLLAHADSLNPLRYTSAEFYRLVDPANPIVRDQNAQSTTLAQLYTESYEKYKIGKKARRELMDQEVVNYFLQLYTHGIYSEEQVAPAKDIIDQILSGDIVRGSGAQVGTESGEPRRAAARTQGREFDALGFYSKALEAAKAWPQKKGTPEQVLQHLIKAGTGVKNEIAATKLKEFLEGKKSVSRDEVVSYLRENRVEVREAVYSLDQSDAEALARSGMRPIDQRNLREGVARPGPGMAGVPKWSRHSLDPSNPTYRETVLHLPARDADLSASVKAGHVDPAEAAQFSDQSLPDFFSGHFPEPNAIADIMSSLQVDANGESTFVPSQVQSDWGQEILKRTRDAVAKSLFDPSKPEVQARIAELQQKLEAANKEREAFLLGEPLQWLGEIGNAASRFGDIGSVTSAITYLAHPRDVVQADMQQIASAFLADPRNSAPAAIRTQITALELRDKRFRDLPESLKSEVSNAISDARAKGEVPAGARDERKIAELRKRDAEMQPALDKARADLRSAEQQSGLGSAEANAAQAELARVVGEKRRVMAELQTAEAATPSHPLVNTTDQWLTTTLRHVIRQAIAANAKSISIPSGQTVLSYNPGQEEGMEGFYDRIVPQTLAKVLQGIDKSIKSHKVDTVGSPVDGRQIGKGFTVFPLTDKVVKQVQEEGLALFSLQDRLSRLGAEERQDTPPYTDAFAARLPETVPAIESWMRKMLPPEIAVRVVDRLVSGGYNLNARYTFMESQKRIFDRAVEVALNTEQGAVANRTLLVKAFHEITHALREYGRLPGGVYGALLTDKEWQVAVERAKKVGIDGKITILDENGKPIPAIPIYRKWYTEQLRAAGFKGEALKQRVEELLNQERVAVLGEQWAEGTSFGAKIDGFFERIVKFFEAIRNALRGLGFQTYDDVFKSIASGEVGSRPTGGRIEPTFEPFPNPPTPAQVHLSSEEGREALDIILPALIGGRVVFTPEMEEAVLHGLKQGVPSRELADRIGVDRSVLQRYVRSLGMEFVWRNPNQRTDILVDDLVSLYMQGASVSQLAAQVGASKSTIWQMLRDAGVDTESRQKPLRDLDAVRQVKVLREQGHSFGEIARRMGLTKSKVSSIYRDLRSGALQLGEADEVRTDLPSFSSERPAPETLVGVHSTSDEFEQFKVTQRRDAGYWGDGVYMFPMQYAREWGGRPGSQGIAYGLREEGQRSIPTAVNAKKPFTITNKKPPDGSYDRFGSYANVDGNFAELKEHGWPYAGPPVYVWNQKGYKPEKEPLTAQEAAEEERRNARSNELYDQIEALRDKEFDNSATAEDKEKLRRLDAEWRALGQEMDLAAKKRRPQARLAQQFTQALLSAGYDAVLIRDEGEAPYEMVAIKPGTVQGLYSGQEMFSFASERPAPETRPFSVSGFDGTVTEKLKETGERLRTYGVGVGQGEVWRHRETGTVAVSAERYPAAGYRNALSLARAMSQRTGNHPVYVFKTVESTLTGPVWRYSLVEPPVRDAVGTVHRVEGGEGGTLPSSNFIVSEQPDGSWELTFFKADDASNIREMVSAIEQDIGKPISPKGWLTPQGYQYWLSVAPEKVRYHVNAGELFGGMYASPRAVEFAEAVLAEAAARGQDTTMTKRPREFYRGTNPGDERRIATVRPDWDANLFASDSIEGASWYGKQIERITAKPDARILYEGTKEFRSLAKGLKDKNLLEQSAEIANRAKAAGWDAVWFKRQTDLGTVILDRRKFDLYGPIDQASAPNRGSLSLEATESARAHLSVLKSSIPQEAFQEARREERYSFASEPPLDMSPEARKARAEEMGFDTSRVLYRGQLSALPNTLDDLPHLTADPGVADLYAGGGARPEYTGGNIMPVWVKARKVLVIDRDPGHWNAAMRDLGIAPDNLLTSKQIARVAGERGYDLVEFHLDDIGGPQVQFIPTSLANVRSTNAAFDPKEEGSPILLASLSSAPPGGPQLPTTPPSQQVRGLSDIISDLKSALGLTITQGLYGMRVRDRAGNRTYGFRPQSNIRSQYDANAGVARVRISTDIDAIAREGGRHVERVFGAPMQAFLQTNAEELATPPAPDAPLPTIAPTGYSGIDLDADTQRVLVEAGDAMRQWQANRTYENAARAAVATHTLEHRLGRTIGQALVADITGAAPLAATPVPVDPAGAATYVQQRYSATGTPKPRVAPTVAPAELSEAFSDFFRRYITDPDGVKRDMPGIYTAFGEFLDANDPAMLQDLERVQIEVLSADYKAYRLATAAERGLADVATMQPDNIGQRLSDWYQTGRTWGGRWDLFKQWLSWVGSSLSYEMTDRTNPILKTQQALLRVADANGIRDSEGRPISLQPSENAHRIARMQSGADKIGHQMITHGVPDYQGLEPVGPSLHDALVLALGGTRSFQWNDSAIRRFGLYLEVRRAIAEWPRFLAGEISQPTRRSLEENQRIIAEHEAANPNYRQASQMVYDWQHRLLTLEYMAGKWTKEAYDELTKRKGFYVPFMRDLSDLVPMAGAPQGSRLTTRFTAGKKFKGSQRDIINPIESLVKRAHEVAASVQFNDMVKALTNLSERAGPGGAGFIERVQKEETLAANQRTFERIKQEAIKLGVDPADAHMIVQKMEHNFTDASVQLLFDPDNMGPQRPPIVPLWENGERRLVRLNDPVMGRRLFDAMNALGREQANWLIRVVSGPASLLRAGVTMHPAFVISNILADMQAAWALTGAPPVITQAKGLYYLLATNPTVNAVMRTVGITPPKLANLYATIGGIAGGQNVAAIRAAGYEYDIHSLRQKGYHVLNLPALGGLGMVGAGAAAGGVVAGPVGATLGASVGAVAARFVFGQGAERAFAQLSEMSETVTRLGVASHAAKRARKLYPAMSDIDVIREAAFTARDVIDFDRAGARAGTLLKLIPFLNSNLQGVSKAYRQGLLMDGERGRINMEKVRLFLRWQVSGTGAFQQKVSARDQQAIRDGARLWVNMMIMAAVATAITFLFSDDPEYDDVRKQVRNTHYVFKLWGTWYRIKKPFELAQFANIGEAFYDWMFENDPRLMARMWSSFKDTHSPPFLPQGYNLITGWLTGMDVGRPGSGEPRPIVPDSLSRLPASEQYNAYTSAFSLAWSKALQNVGINISPMMIDWTINSELAYWGREIRVSSDYAFGSRAPQWTDMPIIGTMLNRFTHDPSRSSESIQEFWKLMGRGNGEFDEAYAGYDAYLKRGNPNAVMAYLAGLSPEERTYAVLQRHFRGNDQSAHPLNRANIIYRVNSGMRREMAEPDGLISTAGGARGESIPLAPAQRAQLDNILGRLSAVEAWNALHMVGRPGWGERQVRDPQPVLDELQAASPEAYAEMMRRRRHPDSVGLRGRVGTFQEDMARWRDVEGRVNQMIQDDDMLGQKWQRTFRNRKAPTRQMQQPEMVQ